MWMTRATSSASRERSPGAARTRVWIRRAAGPDADAPAPADDVAADGT
jgi:hypothetical protein